MEKLTKEAREEYITLLKQKIELKKLEVELQELNTRFTKLKAEEIHAIEFISSKTNPSQNTKEYELTQEDLDANPELAEQGFVVGQKVMIPVDPSMSNKKETESAPMGEKSNSSKGLKKV